MVLAIDHAQNHVREPDCVVIAIQNPLVAVNAQSAVRSEGRQCCPVRSLSGDGLEQRVRLDTQRQSTLHPLVCSRHAHQ